MQTETQATESATETAQTVDTTAAATEAQASATEATAKEPGTSSTTETAADDSGKQQDEQARDDKGQFKSGVQKRIDDLTFRRNQAEREVARLQQVIAESKQPALPKASDFNTDEEYHAAMLDHRIEDGVNRRLSKDAQAQVQKFSTEANQAAGEAYNQRVADVVSRIPDFVEIVSKADIAISPALQEALRDSEKGPDLVYHLAKNPAEAKRLSDMPVRQMDREIGRLELTIGSKTPPAPPAARTTNAPPPVKPGSPAASPASNDPNKMNQAQYEAWAKANGSKYIR